MQSVAASFGFDLTLLSFRPLSGQVLPGFLVGFLGVRPQVLTLCRYGDGLVRSAGASEMDDP